MGTINISNLVNCTTNIDPTTIYSAGDTVNITVTADSGYYFTSAPYLRYSSKGVYTNKYLESSESSEYKTTYSKTITLSGSNWSLIGTTQVIPETDLYGIVNIYNPTIQDLKTLSQVRFMNGVDLSNYITSLKKIFVTVPQGSSANILLGGYDTSISCNVVTSESIDISCGSVTIVMRYNNNFDYEYSNVDIYLAFVGYKSLDTELVMGKTITLTYKVDVTTGESVAILTDDNNHVLYTFECDISIDVPYTLSNSEEVHNVKFNNNYLYGLDSFIRVKSYDKINATSYSGSTDYKTTLSSVSGYRKCKYVLDSVTNATMKENEEIVNILCNGVI